jgi:hypothetical protein
MITLFVLDAAAQTSFDEHFSLAKQGKLGPREMEFAKLCNVERSAVKIVYERSVDENWTFKPVPSVGSGRYDAEMDYLRNAELWILSGRPRLISVWFLIMDTGNTSNEMFCLDESGRVVTQESLNIYEPNDGSAGGWRHLTIRSLPLGEKPRILTDAFLNAAGHRIEKPKLNKDDFAEANAHVSPDLAKDLIAKISLRTK